MKTQLSFDLGEKYFLLTYHSATLADEPPLASFNAIISALDKYPHHQLIITYPNADDGGREIIKQIESLAAQFPERILAIPTLGFLKYFSAVKYATAVIGNSSSGIIEVPAFNVPSINIGQRQAGRMSADSVIHCAAQQSDIEQALKLADEGQVKFSGNNPYALTGDNNEPELTTSERIVQVLAEGSFSTQKSFYDLAPFANNR